jgi:hypothetical protein
LIVGNQQVGFQNVMKPDIWQHVAVVIESGGVQVYLNGELK